MNNNENKNKSDRKLPIIIFLIAAVILLGITVGYLSIRKLSDYPGGIGFTIDSVNKDKNDVNEQNVTIPGITAMHIKSGEDRLVTGLYNPVENSGLYYLTFELSAIIDGKSELLYSSGLVEPGNGIYEIKLNKTFEKGTYNAVVHIQPYRMDKERTPTNNADIIVVIIAE